MAVFALTLHSAIIPQFAADINMNHCHPSVYISKLRDSQVLTILSNKAPGAELVEHVNCTAVRVSHVGDNGVNH